MTAPHVPLLEVRDLAKTYTQRRTFARTQPSVKAFENINLAVQRGVTLAIVGESGAGKSSLARCLALLETPSRGDIFFEGHSVLALPQRASLSLHRQIQFIFQDPTSALNPRFSAEEIVVEPLLIQRIGTKSQQRERALQLMQLVGLSPDSASKRSLEFSGGQRQRLAIARALALEPRLLILDEALSNLDRANQENILQLLDDLQAAQSLTYIHVSHDLPLVSRFADEVAVMHSGRIIEHKSAEELFAHPEHAYTRQLLHSIEPMDAIWLGRSA
ncbi:MAG: ATP-binding cassette domain-containing protein [Candidatus Acidiferrales bacterium]